MIELDKVKSLLAAPANIVLITHRNPDGDAVGSVLALRFFLEKFHHRCDVLLPSEYPDVFDFLPGIDRVVVYDKTPREAINLIERSDIICCLDFNGLDRIDPLAINLEESRATKILIDHHIDPEPFADYYLSDTDASSTCELVYRFIHLLDQAHKIDIDIATCLFTGIITDTGSFKYGTNPDLYHMAGELKAMGVDDYQLQDAIFNTMTERQLRIMGHALRNRLEVLPEYSAGIIYLDKRDYIKYKISRGDTEGLVNYILMIKGIHVAAFIRQMPTGEIKLSFRSKGDISVQELARNHFQGGGHLNAAGGSSKDDLKTTITRFKEVLPQYVKKLV